MKESKSQIIIDRNGDLLIGPQIPLSRLDGRVSEQEFDLLQIPAVLSAQLGASAAQVMSAEVLDPDLFVQLLTRPPSRSACRGFL